VGSRKLSEDPEKARRQVFKRVFNVLFEWRSLAETGDIHGSAIVLIPTPIGEEIYAPHLLVGLDTLPKRQREAFIYLCLKGMTESEGAELMLPNSKWSTPVQQYSDMALDRMIEAYDLAQAGKWPPKEEDKDHPAGGPKERHLGKRQFGVLEMLDQSNYYFKGCGWVYLSHSETVEVLESLFKRGMVAKTELASSKVVWTLPGRPYEEPGITSVPLRSSGKLGVRQVTVLYNLQIHEEYFKGCGWVLYSHSETIEVLDSLIKKDLVVVDGSSGRLVYQLSSVTP
jgi:hypothetical protein